MSKLSEEMFLDAGSPNRLNPNLPNGPKLPFGLPCERLLLEMSSTPEMLDPLKPMRPLPFPLPKSPNPEFIATETLISPPPTVSVMLPATSPELQTVLLLHEDICNVSEVTGVALARGTQPSAKRSAPAAIPHKVFFTLSTLSLLVFPPGNKRAI